MMCFIAEVCSDDSYAHHSLLVCKEGLWLFHVSVLVVLLPSSARKLDMNDQGNIFFPLLNPCTKKEEVVFQL